MASYQPTPRAVLLGIALAIALLADVAVLRYVDVASQRLWIGVPLLFVVMWLTMQLGVVERLTSMARRFRRRRFLELRQRVDEFIGTVRRLHWLTVDMERGTRSREATLPELDGIESKLHGLIADIRRAAGRESQEAGFREYPEPQEQESTPS